MFFLPPELWIKVLGHVARPDGVGDEFEDWPSYYGWRRTPLNLATVCRDWRELVHACSDMWVGLSYSISDNSITNGGLLGVQAWLARSGSRPLSLEFTCYCQDPLILNAFLEVFYPYFPRLAVLRIGMGGGVWGDILPIPRVDMPLCSFVSTGFANEEYVAWFAPFFRNELPALRALQMREYITSTISHMPVEHHISNLTHLDAVANNFKMRPVDVLRGCPHLVACRLYFRLGHNDDSNGMPGDTTCEPFTMAQLRTLWIRVKTRYYWRDVFAHASFPILEDITLIGSMWPVTTFAPCLKRSRCPLRHLSLPGCNASAIAVVAVLEAVTDTLETFHFSGGDSSGGLFGFNDTLLDALNPQQQTMLVPRLHSLKIISGSALQTTAGKLLDVVRARMTSTRTVPFRTIDLSCYSDESRKSGSHKLDFEGLLRLGQQHSELTVKVYPDMLA